MRKTPQQSRRPGLIMVRQEQCHLLRPTQEMVHQQQGAFCCRAEQRIWSFVCDDPAAQLYSCAAKASQPRSEGNRDVKRPEQDCKLPGETCKPNRQAASHGVHVSLILSHDWQKPSCDDLCGFSKSSALSPSPPTARRSLPVAASIQARHCQTRHAHKAQWHRFLLSAERHLGKREAADRGHILSLTTATLCTPAGSHCEPAAAQALLRGVLATQTGTICTRWHTCSKKTERRPS